MIPPSPAFVSADLAAAAAGCTALTEAAKLAGWVGTGRQLTTTGVPRPAEAVQLCRLLGILLPGPRLRSALDVEALMQVWMVAQEAGFVVVDGRRARAVPSAQAVDDPELILDRWVQAAAFSLGVPDEPCAACLLMLHELRTAGRTLSVADLARMLAEAEGPDMADEPCSDCGEVHDAADMLGLADQFGLGGLLGDEEPDAEDSVEHAFGTLATLAAFGAVTAVSETEAELTPLGSMLGTSLFEGCAPAPDADVQTLVSVAGEVPLPVAMTMVRPWLEARSPADAVRELLTFAESANGTDRIAALTLAGAVGPQGMAGWRELAGRPGFGAYARRWLAEQGEPVEEDPADGMWLLVETLSIMLDDLAGVMPPSMLAAMFQQQIGADVAEAVELMRASGHPAAAEVAASLGGPSLGVAALGVPALGGASRGRLSLVPAPADQTYQLKISLRNVSKPPVWRRVEVSGGITLDELHEVIQRSMGWHDGHMHVFSDGWNQYGIPDRELGHADESRVRLDGLLSGPGEKLLYTYDFGDDWEHDVLLEQIRPAAPDGTVPTCLTGKGRCPPEDCGGPWGWDHLKYVLADPRDEEHEDMLDWLGLDSGSDFDPKKFSVDDVNRRLGSLPRP
ncbi:MAG TPA: plasmid pRiA4b ORF-3 family protein [Streptosporangiaceae bacterium]